MVPVTDTATCPTCNGRPAWGGMGYSPHIAYQCRHRLSWARRELLVLLAKRVAGAATPHDRRNAREDEQRDHHEQP